MPDYAALFFLIFASVCIFYAVIAIHDIPYEIAKKRNRPHLEAIHYAGWVSLFTLHVIWPFLWIWATLWQKDTGWGNMSKILVQEDKIMSRIEQLESENKILRNKLNALEKKFKRLNPNRAK